MIKRLPRYAEKTFQTLCARGGALCHEVDEDESGWDFHVELPAKPFSGPADTQPPVATAYVQVKSVENRRLKCRVKLSNALLAAQSPQPWFVVLVVAGSLKDPVKIYAVHVWEALVRRTLEAVRRAENENKRLNRKWLTIGFEGSDEQGGEIVRWMQETIDAVRPDYSSAKRAVYETVGYEDGRGLAVMTLRAGSKEEILRNFLGVGQGLPVANFTFTPSRFGISSTEPTAQASSGMVHITPDPVGDIEVRLRSPVSAHPMVLPGKAYSVSLPNLPEEDRRVRFSAGFFEMIWRPDGHSEFRANLNFNDRHEMETIENFATLYEWSIVAPIDVQVWFQGRRITRGSVQSFDARAEWDWGQLAGAVRLLRSIAGQNRAIGVKISIYDLFLSSGLRTFSQISAAGSVRFEFDEMPEAPSQFTSMLYWFHVDVGECTFYTLVKRPVAEDILIDGKRRVTTRVHEWLEAYVLERRPPEDRDVMQEDFKRHFDLEKEHGVPLGLRNLRDVIGKSEQGVPLEY